MNKRKLRLRSSGWFVVPGVLCALPITAHAQTSNNLLGQVRTGDFLQSLGVGARSIAMGDAFSALADDASASFWNPGRLSLLQSRQFMVEYHSVPTSNLGETSQFLPPSLSARPYVFSLDVGQPQLSFVGGVWPLESRRHRYEDPLPDSASALSSLSDKPKVGYQAQPAQTQSGQAQSGNKPKVDDKPKDTDYVDVKSYGTIGASYALGGYFQNTSESYQRDPNSNLLLDARSGSQVSPNANPLVLNPQGNLIQYQNAQKQYEPVRLVSIITPTGQHEYQAITLAAGQTPQKGTPILTQTSDQLVSNRFWTLAYGNRTSVHLPSNHLGQLGYGAGLVYLNSGQNFTETPVNDISSVFATSGTGVGVMAGLAYSFGPDYSTYRFGLTYRSAIKINYNADTRTQAVGFADEIPDRISLGAAYDSRIHRDDVRVTAELQTFTAANRSTNAQGELYQEDLRVPVTNVHLGFEYVRNGRNGLSVPVRMGFRTDKGAAVYTSYDTSLVSFGTGIQLKDSNNNQLYNLETAAEIETKRGVAFWTLTGVFRF